jgi:hypothetical protein
MGGYGKKFRAVLEKKGYALTAEGTHVPRFTPAKNIRELRRMIVLTAQHNRWGTRLRVGARVAVKQKPFGGVVTRTGIVSLRVAPGPSLFRKVVAASRAGQRRGLHPFGGLGAFTGMGRGWRRYAKKATVLRFQR